MLRQSKLVDDEVEMVGKLDLVSAGNGAEEVRAEIAGFCQDIEVVGSIRRRKPEVHDIDFVIRASDKGWQDIKAKIISFFCTSTLSVKKVLEGSQIQRYKMPLSSGKYIQLDLYRATSANYGAIKLVRTGSYQHNIWLAKWTIKRGLRFLYSIGIIDGKGAVQVGQKEDHILKVLNLNWIEPEKREIGDDGRPIWAKEWEKYYRG